jgi:glutamine amidotransferase-like uncharacterized protein
VCSAQAVERDAAVGAAGIIAEGRRSETPWYTVDSGEAGPTVLIVGGMHGNEPAGAEAAAQIRHWPLVRGRLVIVPRANPPALAADVRRIPGKRQRVADLNRNFPATQRERGPIGPTAENLWAFINDVRPDWILDLHEGFDFHVRNPRSVGSSVIHFDDPATNGYVMAMLEAVNRDVEDEQRKFQSVSRGPVETGMVRATIQFLGAQGMVLETTRADQPLSLRVRQHRHMVHALLSKLDMVGEGARDVMVPVERAIGEESEINTLRIALYDDAGAAESGINAMMRIARGMQGAEVVRVGGGDIRSGALGQFDVAIFPGGRGGLQGETLGEAGRQQVRAFVEQGGGFVGVCAGAFLATCRMDSYLKMVRTYHHRPWQLGRGPVEIELTELGREIFESEEATFEVRYGNGPVFVHEEGLEPDPDLPEYQILALYTRGVESNGTPRPEMEGTPAIIAAPFGMGRVLLISPHPESSNETAWMVERAMAWVGGRSAGPGNGDGTQGTGDRLTPVR